MDTEIDTSGCRDCAAGLHQAREAVVGWRCPKHGVVSWDAASERNALRAEIDRLREVLFGYARWEADVYEQWEADMLLDSGERPLNTACVLSQPQLDALLRLQNERIAALQQEHPA